jgi:hypothetical protein
MVLSEQLCQYLAGIFNREHYNFIKVMIFQIATVSKVFIVDFHAFRTASNDQKAALQQLLLDLFNDVTIAKVGWAFVNDLRMLGAAGNGMLKEMFLDNHNPMIGFVELTRAVKHYKSIQDFHSSRALLTPGMLKKHKKNAGSLSQCCLMMLGKELNKEQCMSNWDIRPLSREQLIYAALDAHCLLAILDKTREGESGDQYCTAALDLYGSL